MPMRARSTSLTVRFSKTSSTQHPHPRNPRTHALAPPASMYNTYTTYYDTVNPDPRHKPHHPCAHPRHNTPHHHTPNIRSMRYAPPSIPRNPHCLPPVGRRYCLKCIAIGGICHRRKRDGRSHIPTCIARTVPTALEEAARLDIPMHNHPFNIAPFLFGTCSSFLITSSHSNMHANNLFEQAMLK